jgi:hypothetical protein
MWDRVIEGRGVPSSGGSGIADHKNAIKKRETSIRKEESDKQEKV